MLRHIPVQQPNDDLSYAGVDVGGTNIKVGLVRGTDITHTTTIPTWAERGPDQALTRAAKEVGLIQQSLAGKAPAIAAVGVGVPGLVCGRTLAAARNLPGWNDVAICEQLEGLLGIPAYLETDARAIALGEIYFGIHPPVDRGVILTLGTGVGGATFERDGDRYTLCLPTSAIGLALCFDDGSCGGETGLRYVEDLVSGSAITLRTRAYREQLGFPPPHPIDAQAVFEKASAGDNSCRDILDEVGKQLGLLLVTLIHIFNPQVIVLGGGVAQSGRDILPRIREVVQTYTVPMLFDQVRIEVSELGRYSGACGAALFAALSSVQTRREIR